MSSKRFYPKKKINYQRNDFIRKLDLRKIEHLKWNFLKLKTPQSFKIKSLTSKFEKKWLRRRFREELRIKQALKYYYGSLREKNFQKYLILSLNNKTKQNSQEILIQKLEVRLDIFLTRSKLFGSTFESRQNILHKKIWLCKPNEINFSLIRKPSYKIQAGDLFKIKFKPNWSLESNHKYFKILKKNDLIYLLVTSQPLLTELNFSFKLNLKEVFNWGRRY